MGVKLFDPDQLFSPSYSGDFQGFCRGGFQLFYPDKLFPSSY